MIASSEPLKGIARLLKISVKTVEYYKSRIVAKTGLRDLPALTREAIRKGLVQL